MSTQEVKSENLEVEGAIARELPAMAEEILTNGEVTLKLDGNTLAVVRSKPKKATGKAGKEETEEETPKKGRDKAASKEKEAPAKKTKKKAAEFDPTDLEEFDECEDLEAIEAWAEENEVEYVKATSDAMTIKRIRKAAIKKFEWEE